MKLKGLAFLVGMLNATSGHAEAFSNEELAGLSLDQLLDVPVSVATLTNSTTRESPGIITVITRDQIENLGARDLRDVLRVVPGFGIGQDAAYGLGLSLRGNWGMEGKILVLVDDQIWNEASFGSAIVNGSIPLQLVEKIEIIRGPGSVIYGNYAELGVIKITTRGRAKKGGNVFAGSAKSQRDSNRALVGFNQHTEDKLSLSVQAASDQMQLSDEHNQDLSGAILDERNHTPISQEFGSFGVDYQNLSFNAIHEQHHFSGIGDYTSSTPWLQSEFNMSLFELKYTQFFSEKLNLDYRLNYREVEPWISDETAQLDGGFDPRESFDQTVTSKRAAVTANGQATAQLKWVAGVEYSHDVDKYTMYPPHNVWNSGGDELTYRNDTFFAQTEYKTPAGTLTVGGRFEKHNRYGGFWVPRLGWQNVLNKFHYKILASRAFRNPAFENVDVNPGIKRERTRVYEVEFGYQISPNSYLTTNLFDIQILNPIIYFVDNDNAGYINYPSTGSRGAEFAYQFKTQSLSLNLSYSYYRSAYLNADLYQIPNHSGMLLGFPSNKIALYGGWNFLPEWVLGGSLVYESKKYGQMYLPEEADYGVGPMPSITTSNLNLNWKPRQIKNLQIQAGIYNLTNKRYYFVQPYLNSASSPISDLSRELMVSINYGW
ncbi:MAG TPA: TonB-dependent receptor plug domain-containing protein [Pseudomonadales bacterium]|nr:TonB-dependent receptor plug domain-containing protein [Pseudomonadales bacterium]